MTLQFTSTNGQSPAVNLREALLAGQAPDRGLYFLKQFPRLTPEELILRAKAIGSSLAEIKHYLDLYGTHGEGRGVQGAHDRLFVAAGGFVTLDGVRVVVTEPGGDDRGRVAHGHEVFSGVGSFLASHTGSGMPAASDATPR